MFDAFVQKLTSFNEPQHILIGDLNDISVNFKSKTEIKRWFATEFLVNLVFSHSYNVKCIDRLLKSICRDVYAKNVSSPKQLGKVTSVLEMLVLQRSVKNVLAITSF